MGSSVWIYKKREQGKEKGNFQYIDLLLPILPFFLFDEIVRRRYYRGPNFDPEEGLVSRGIGSQCVFS
jgi:hypothetical protein